MRDVCAIGLLACRSALIRVTSLDDFMWGRLLTCGRLVIGLLAVLATPRATPVPFAACCDVGQVGRGDPASVARDHALRIAPPSEAA
jgi:hypothetical protein